MARKHYLLGPITGSGRTKTEARADAEKQAIDLARRVEKTRPGVFKGIGDIQYIIITTALDCWKYAWIDSRGYRIITYYYNKTYEEVVEHAINHVADLYMGDPEVGDAAFIKGTDWVCQMADEQGLTNEYATRICADIDYKRRARIEINNAKTAIG